MKPYGQEPPLPTGGLHTDWNSPAPPETSLEESMWQLGLGGGSGNPYPERPDVADCVYYMRTGFCRYGAVCRFNHPRDRSGVPGMVRAGGELPVRLGQPVCQYYLKTRACKYGAACKYHHPRDGGGSENPVSLNYYGYPLRPGEKECAYYVKTGQCKFGSTCKFHHPQPAGISLPASAPTFYPAVQSPSVPPPQYGMASWPVARPPVVPNSYVQGPYGPVLISSGVVQVPAWSPYTPLVSPIASPGTQPSAGTSSLYSSTHQLSPSAPAYVGPFSSSFTAGPSSSSQKEHRFPQRPGLPECQFYMKTGDCKYGSSCRYHHPVEGSLPQNMCAVSPIGLPLRPGAPVCTFYVQHGICRFGLTCKFDHPMGLLSYNASPSSLADMPVIPYPVESSLATLTSSSSMELQPSSVPQSRVQVSTQNPATLSGSHNTGHGSMSS